MSLSKEERKRLHKNLKESVSELAYSIYCGFEDIYPLGLVDGFQWNLTPEGFQYWKDIHARLYIEYLEATS